MPDLPEGLALVLSGGGAKGAYQIGAWKYMKEAGIADRITAVAGTSIGALNGALFVQGNYDVAEYIWENVSEENILQLDGQNLWKLVSAALSALYNPSEIIALLSGSGPEIFYRAGIFKRESLENIIKLYLSLKKVSESDITCYATCTRLPAFEAEYFKLNGRAPEEIMRILLASSAIPGIFNIEKLDGEPYIDGGARDNLPIKPLYDEGYRDFIVINLDPDKKVNTDKFPGARIWEIRPVDNPQYFTRATLNFSSQSAKKRMEIGYNDAKQRLGGFAD